MIISCPQCGTAYDVPDGASFIGRKVRCKACQTVWRVEAAPARSADADSQVWADPLAMLREGRESVAGRPDPAPEAARTGLRQRPVAVPSAPPPSPAPMAAAPAASPAEPAKAEPAVAVQAAAASQDAGWPDWPKEGDAAASAARKAARKATVEALTVAPPAAALAQPAPSSEPAVSASMAASLERRRQARERNSFDDVEAAIAAVRTAPVNGPVNGSAAGHDPTPDGDDLLADERDRPQRPQPASARTARAAPEPDFEFAAADQDEPSDDLEDDDGIDAGRAGRAQLIVGWVALTAAVAGLVAFAYLGAETVLRTLPGMAPLYAAVGLPVNSRGLEFAEVAYEWKLDQRGKPVLPLAAR
jgi:predicted Zn finger-like uncharacterized protein